MKGSLVLAVGIVACCYSKSIVAQDENSINTKNSHKMTSYISIFEIPATEINRAVKFYQSILDISIEIIDMQGTQMGLFPGDDQQPSGVITQGEGYEPAPNGVIIYLNGGKNLQTILDKVENSGGKIVVPKTLIDEENGYFALFLDTEGNRLGLHSPN